MSAQGSSDRERNRAIFRRRAAERKHALRTMTKTEKRDFLRREAAERERTKKTALLPKLVEGIGEPGILEQIPSRLRAALCPSTVRPLLRWA